jgi:hypothetical protein
MAQRQQLHLCRFEFEHAAEQSASHSASFPLEKIADFACCLH